MVESRYTLRSRRFVGRTHAMLIVTWARRKMSHPLVICIRYFLMHTGDCGTNKSCPPGYVPPRVTPPTLTNSERFASMLYRSLETSNLTFAPRSTMQMSLKINLYVCSRTASGIVLRQGGCHKRVCHQVCRSRTGASSQTPFHVGESHWQTGELFQQNYTRSYFFFNPNFHA